MIFTYRVAEEQFSAKLLKPQNMEEGLPVTNIHNDDLN